MATNRSGHRPGGGIASRVNVRPPVRTGSGSRGTRPGGAASIGQSYGSHITNKSDTGYRGPKFHSDRNPAMSVPFGNEKALDVGPGGCGTGRTIYKTGTQQQYGSGGAPEPAGRDILGAFGPESKRS
jgi:hypothetical protein